MAPDQPQVRYYDARGRRRWLAPLVAVFLLLGVGGIVGVGLLRADDGTTGTTDAGTSGLPKGVPATSPESIAPEDTEASSVAMVGDSITQGSEPALRYTLTASGLSTIDIDGVTSRRIEVGGAGSKNEPESGLHALQRLLDAGVAPDVWVVALGTNDVGQYSDPEEYRRVIREVLALLPDDTPLVWVDVYRFDHLDDTADFNRIVREELDERGDATVVSWFDQASTRSDEILRSDHIHPNKEGNAVFARLVAQGIADVT